MKLIVTPSKHSTTTSMQAHEAVDNVARGLGTIIAMSPPTTKTMHPGAAPQMPGSASPFDVAPAVMPAPAPAPVASHVLVVDDAEDRWMFMDIGHLGLASPHVYDLCKFIGESIHDTTTKAICGGWPLWYVHSGRPLTAQAGVPVCDTGAQETVTVDRAIDLACNHEHIIAWVRDNDPLIRAFVGLNDGKEGSIIWYGFHSLGDLANLHTAPGHGRSLFGNASPFVTVVKAIENGKTVYLFEDAADLISNIWTKRDET